MKKIGLLLIIALFFCVGCKKEVENKKITIEESGKLYSGSYTGVLNDGKASGTGIYFDDKGWSYNGKFERGLFSGEGEVENFPCSIEFQNETYEGEYTGSVRDLSPQGEGTFVGSKQDYKIEYEGRWAEGTMSGAGTMKSNHYAVRFEGDKTVVGTYNGELVNGVAEGKGTFNGKNSNDEEYTYTGEFYADYPQGIGKLQFKDKKIGTLSGRFERGEFRPDKIADALNAFGSGEEFKYSVSEKNAKFIEKHKDYFVGNGLSNVSKDPIDHVLTYEDYIKQPEIYEKKLVSWSGYTINEIWVEKSLYGGDPYVIFTAYDYYGENYIYVFCLNCGKDSYEASLQQGSSVNIMGMPIASSGYKNVSGGKTNCVVLLACQVN